MTPTGFELPRETPGKTENRARGGAESGALVGIDEDLARIVEAWPHLPGAVREAIGVMVEAGLGR